MVEVVAIEDPDLVDPATVEIEETEDTVDPKMVTVVIVEKVLPLM